VCARALTISSRPALVKIPTVKIIGIIGNFPELLGFNDYTEYCTDSHKRIYEKSGDYWGFHSVDPFYWDFDEVRPLVVWH
jgi:hypothetical protein